MPNIFLTISLFFLVVKAEARPYVVMSSTDATVKEKIDLSDLRDIYMGNRLFWTDGERIYPTHVKKDSKSMSFFLNQVLSMSPRKYNKYWRRRLFSGKGHPPKETDSDKEALDYVSQTKGSIAIISQLPTKKFRGLYFFEPQKDYQTLRRIVFNSNRNINLN